VKCLSHGARWKTSGNQKKSWFGISKNCEMEKNYMQIPKGQAGKTLIAEVTRLIRLFNSSNTHASSTSATNTPEAISQIKK